jgi:hypothetical protein
MLEAQGIPDCRRLSRIGTTIQQSQRVTGRVYNAHMPAAHRGEGEPAHADADRVAEDHSATLPVKVWGKTYASQGSLASAVVNRSGAASAAASSMISISSSINHRHQRITTSPTIRSMRLKYTTTTCQVSESARGTHFRESECAATFQSKLARTCALLVCRYMRVRESVISRLERTMDARVRPSDTATTAYHPLY